MSSAELSTSDLVEVMRAFRQSLQLHQATINRLNVFPVPDGDTGTNMLLTLESVCSALDGLDQSEVGVMAPVSAAIAKGSLMGARGNSGVILCQVLRAMTDEIAGLAVVGPAALAQALVGADTAARSAVSRPVEGTILTVAAGAARAATDAAGEGADLSAVIEAARQGAVVALASTPKLLAVLDEAGVVDAGGAGLTLLFDALAHVVGQRPLPDALELPDSVARALVASPSSAPVDGGLIDTGEGIGPRFEVMFLLDADDAPIAALRARFDEIGDSTVIVGSSPMFNCHVHTDDIGAAIEAAIVAGRPHEIRVTDLNEQVEEERWVREVAGGLVPEPRRGTPPITSVVAVATGAGVRRIFTSLGVARLVAGGQSMNPSTADILDMAEATSGAEVVLLPNNKNILAVARQVATLSTKPVYVVETEGIQEGFAALLAYDPGAGGEENARLMTDAAARVVAGEVTQAVRAASTPAGAVAAGDWIGLSRSGIEAVGDSLVTAASTLIDHLVSAEHGILTLIEGNGAAPGEVDQVESWIVAAHPELAVERHLGGQPLYPLLVALE